MQIICKLCGIDIYVFGCKAIADMPDKRVLFAALPRLVLLDKRKVAQDFIGGV